MEHIEHIELLELVQAHEHAEKALKASSLAVWAALTKAEPELADDIRRLFGTTDAAATWAASPFGELGGSPARQAAEGRAAIIVSIVRKADHGFLG